VVSKKCTIDLTDWRLPTKQRLLSRPQAPNLLTSHEIPPQLEATEQKTDTDAGNAKTSKKLEEVRLAAIDLNDCSSGRRLPSRPQTSNQPPIEHC
jgi:hypothetical protein